MSPKSRTPANKYQKIMYKARRLLRHPGFDLLRGNPSDSQGSLMVITPGRIGNAVERNTIRRRFKALFHELGLIKPGYDWVVIVKKDGVKLSHATLKEILVHVLSSEIS